MRKRLKKKIARRRGAAIICNIAKRTIRDASVLPTIDPNDPGLVVVDEDWD